MHMDIGEEIFPEGCGMAYKDGKLSLTGEMFMLDQRRNDWEKKGVEHPCYSCIKKDCKARQIEYHAPGKMYIVRPERFLS